MPTGEWVKFEELCASIPPVGRGASWIRADFHFHTPASEDHEYGSSSYEQIAEKIAALRLDAVFVTDHNEWKGIEPLTRAVATLGLKTRIYPGAELSVMAVAARIGEGLTKNDRPRADAGRPAASAAGHLGRPVPFPLLSEIRIRGPSAHSPLTAQRSPPASARGRNPCRPRTPRDSPASRRPPRPTAPARYVPARYVLDAPPPRRDTQTGTKEAASVMLRVDRRNASGPRAGRSAPVGRVGDRRAEGGVIGAGRGLGGRDCLMGNRVAPCPSRRPQDRE